MCLKINLQDVSENHLLNEFSFIIAPVFSSSNGISKREKCARDR